MLAALLWATPTVPMKGAFPDSHRPFRLSLVGEMSEKATISAKVVGGGQTGGGERGCCLHASGPMRLRGGRKIRSLVSRSIKKNYKTVRREPSQKEWERMRQEW